MTRISVIIPLYNKENYIIDTLQSALKQTFKDFELLIINDCCTDTSLQLVNAVKDPRIKIINHPNNKGLSASRNTGIKAAKSRYIAFLDADDLWHPLFLERIDFLIKELPKADLFATKYEVLLKKNQRLTHHFNFEEFETYGIVSNFFTSNLNQSIFYPSCLCVRKSVFENIGYYNEDINYSEDIDFNIRANIKYKLAYYNEPLVTYLLISENQITQNGLAGKTIPDYDYYENTHKDRSDLKRYLDFQRYIKAKLFRLGSDSEGYKEMIAGIDLKNLNWKQRLLLKAPKFVLENIARFKHLSQSMGFNLSSY